MRLPTVRRSVAVATITSAMLAGAVSAASATDLRDDDYCTSGPAVVPAPVHQSGTNAAPTPQDDQLRALVNGVSVLNVRANDTDPDNDGLGVVSASAGANGETCIDDGNVVYGWTGEDDEDATTDTVKYAVTDGDAYRTATVNVDLYQVQSFAPKVKQKAIVKNGKLTRKATITFYNADPNYNVEVEVGDPNGESYTDYTLAKRTGAAYTAKTITTAKRYLEFFTVVYDKNNVAFVQDAVTDSITGKTTVDSDEGYYVESFAKHRPASVKAWFRATHH